MQTLHLRLRDLRAVSPGAQPPADSGPRRCQRHRGGRARRPFHTIPDQPARLERVPRRVVDWPVAIVRAGGPSRRALRLDRCPCAGAGLPRDTPRRRPAVGAGVARDSRPVCRWQTAGTGPQPAARQVAGQAVDRFLHPRAPALLRTASHALSRSLRRRRSTARHGGTGTAGVVAYVAIRATAEHGVGWVTPRVDSMAVRCGRAASAGVARRPWQRPRLRRRPG